MLIDVLVIKTNSSEESFRSLADKYKIGMGKGFKTKQTKLQEFLLSELLKISEKDHEKVDKKSQDDYRMPLTEDSSNQYDNPKKLHENSIDNQKSEIPKETIENFKKLLDEKLYELAQTESKSL
jgi:hypothetical protein